MFVAEGLRTIEEGMKAGIHPALLFYTLPLLDASRGRQLLLHAEGQGVPIKAVSEAVMSFLADTVTPSGLLAVFPIPICSIPRPLSWVLVVDNLRDPGNLGTILRSALAAGVELMLATTGTVDAYSPKVVRAGMGAHFRLNLCVNQPWRAIQEAVGGLQVFLATPGQGSPYWEVDWRQPVALVIGSEAEGATSQAETLATARVMIPMRQDVESLNAAVAASVLLFEAARQRSL